MEVDLESLLIESPFNDFDNEYVDLGGLLFNYLKFVSIVAFASIGTTAILSVIKKLFPQRDTSHDAATVPEGEDVVKKIKDIYDLSVS